MDERTQQTVKQYDVKLRQEGGETVASFKDPYDSGTCELNVDNIPSLRQHFKTDQRRLEIYAATEALVTEQQEKLEHTI